MPNTTISLEWPVNNPQAFQKNLQALADLLKVTPAACLTALVFGDEEFLTLGQAVEVIESLDDEELAICLIDAATYGACFSNCRSWKQVHLAYHDILALTQHQNSKDWEALLEAALLHDIPLVLTYGQKVFRDLRKDKWPNLGSRSGEDALLTLQLRLSQEPSGPFRFLPPSDLEKQVAILLQEDTLDLGTLQDRVTDVFGCRPKEPELLDALKYHCEEVRFVGVKSPSYRVKPGTRFELEGEAFYWPVQTA